ncbi:MAG: DUF4256 domain-containing protein [Spirochaetaceae bacterium]|nr:DUF4256 domain-containing protein [Spirochaetaceae bacterium]
MKKGKTLDSARQAELFGILRARFEKNRDRHAKASWERVQAGLEASPEKAWAVNEMERTGGEPDVVEFVAGSGSMVFCDCSAESPAGRRSLCYDREALESRKENRPADSAVGMAEAMGVELMTEEEYRLLQGFGSFDAKTSSWIKTPKDIRKLGGALFADRRYDHVFTYHNGAESYYAARGFRGIVRL